MTRRTGRAFGYGLLILWIGVASPEAETAQLSTAEQTEVTQVLSLRWLWDPISPDLADWQAIGRQPADLIFGRPGELFVSDTQNARVIHFTTQGELLNIIGREGDGPGEFREPKDLAYDEDRDILWVREGGSGARISRFIRTNGTFEYLNCFPFPAVIGSGEQNLLLNDENSYWTVSSKVQYGDYGGVKARIQLCGTDGSLLQEFGPFWGPLMRDAPWTVRPANRGFIERCGEDHIAFLAANKPILELWDLDGELVAERVFTGPDFKIPSPERVSDSRTDIYAHFMISPSYLPARDLLYIRHGYTFWGLDPETLQTIEEYQLPVPEDREERIAIKKFLVIEEDDAVKFYVLDLRSSTVGILEPTEELRR